MAARAGTKASFKVGKKILYLPSFSIAMCRVPSDSANIARFKVPLWFSKFDIRDYLWHAYTVEIVAARSHVKMRPVQQGKDDQIRPTVKRWFRPRAHKYMTVELLEPFVWPEDNSNERAFGKDDLKMAKQEQEAANKFMGSLGDAAVDDDHREKMREQAQALLSGKERWTPPEITYNNIATKQD